MIERLDSERDALIALHQHIRNRISQGVDSDFEQYEERAMIHSIIESPKTVRPKSPKPGIAIRATASLTELLEEVRSKLQRQISQRAGHVIVTPENSDLYWWLGDYKSSQNIFNLQNPIQRLVRIVQRFAS